MSPTDQVCFGLRAFSYVAVKHVPLVEPILKRISGGRINRHSLAQAVWRSAVELGSKYAVDAKWLGERSSTVIPLLVRAFTNNDPEQMKSAIRQLTSETLGFYVQKDASGLCGSVARPLHDMAGNLAETLSTAFLGDHAAEKILATMRQKYGFEPIEQYLRKNVGQFFGREFAIRQTMHCLEDLVDDPAYLQTGSQEYEALADILYHKLRGRPNSDCVDVLRNYAPEGFAAVRALREMGQDMIQLGLSVVDFGKTAIADPGAVLGEGMRAVAAGVPRLVDSGKHLIADVIPAAADSAQRMLGQVAPRPLELVYSDRAAALASLPPTASDRDIAHTILHEFVELASSADLCIEPNPSDITQACIEWQITSLAHADAPARMQRVADALSPAQLMPLGPRGDTRVSKTWGGHVAEIRGTNHHWLTPNSVLDGQVERVLRAAPTEVTLCAGHEVGKPFAERLGQLNLIFDGGKPGGQGIGVLAQLYEACGRDDALMRASSQYLDEALAHQALVTSTEATRRDKDSGLIDAGRVAVAVAPAPRYAFHVHRAAGFVKIGIEARWTITAYGPSADNLRKPRGTASSSLVAGASVTLRPEAQGAVAVTCEATGMLATIENIIAFDPKNGAMLEPTSATPADNAFKGEKSLGLPQVKRASAAAAVSKGVLPLRRAKGAQATGTTANPSKLPDLPAAVVHSVGGPRIIPPAIAPRLRWAGMANADGQLEID